MPYNICIFEFVIDTMIVTTQKKNTKNKATTNKQNKMKTKQKYNKPNQVGNIKQIFVC